MDVGNRMYSGPTSFLPSLVRLRTCSVSDITGALRSLRDLYWPTAHQLPIQFSIPRRKFLRSPRYDVSVPDSGYASAAQSDDECGSEDAYGRTCGVDKSSDMLKLLRGDPFERAFTIKWITGFIGRFDTWLASNDELSTSDSTPDDILNEATALLCLFSASNVDESDCAVTRTFSFPSPSNLGDTRTIDVQLNDAPLLIADHTSVGLQSWGSAILLAERICAAPNHFGLPVSEEKGGPLRVLELGAGTGLLSIVIAKLLPFSQTSVIATDYHPDVLANLIANVHANFPSVSSSQLPVEVHALDWQCPSSSSLPHETFDMVIAADVIYHPEHAAWIKGCLEKVLARPGDWDEEGAGGIFWLVIPLRESGRYEGIDKTVDTVFQDRRGGFSSAPKGDESRHWHLVVLEREEAGRQSRSIGRADEGGYRLFKIGWSSGL